MKTPLHGAGFLPFGLFAGCASPEIESAADADRGNEGVNKAWRIAWE